MFACSRWTECKDFTDKVLLPEHGEFVLVKCYKREKKKEKEFYRDMHPVVPVLPNAFLKMKAAEENVTSKLKTLNSEAKKLNVIILGIDSISKLNLRRVMPRTLNYLHEKNWIELKGYNKIGENTFPNLMAILNGKPTESVSLWWSNGSVKMDDCPAIWKDYNNAGYITLYAEDTPAISTFNYMKMGFVEKPTDYYMRPFMLAAHEKLYLKKLNGLPVCTGPVLALDHILNYAKRFYRTFKNFNHFSLLWSNSLSHNHLNAPKALDTSVVRFLNDLSDLGVYENSLVLLLSDHGMRFGEIRKTFIGYIEERSPFMFIWVPEWFQKKYPRKYYNMVINQNRLTSPFDIYVTLKTLLEMDDDKDFRRPNDTPFFENELIRTDPISEACPKCNGLFEVQPLNRTCSDASIDVNWCLCSEFREIDVQEKMALKVGLHIYNYIINKTNELIKREKIKKTLCSSWTFSKIYRGQEITVQNSRKKNFVYGYGEKRSNERIFVILIELNPGNTKFESSVKIYSDHNGENLKYEFLEYPKRLDSIYKTSECVKSSLLKHYCYCVRQ